MRAPGFWNRPPGALAALLAPLSLIWRLVTRRRLARPKAQARVPVICCGGITVGGGGKTTVALDILRRLRARGVRAHALTRGYGGRRKTPLRVEPRRHDADLVGDEALLLAAAGPAWVARRRAEGAEAAVAEGAEAIVLDDGLQHPGLAHDLALLVIDGATGLGNGQVIPAGPLRETLADILPRVRAVVVIGPDDHGLIARLPPETHVLRAGLRPAGGTGHLRGRAVFAVSGIALPGKFHRSLSEMGARLAGHADFSDHHSFTEAELRRVLARAGDALPVTTAKDHVRMPARWRSRFTVLPIELAWEDEAALEALLTEALTTVMDIA